MPVKKFKFFIIFVSVFIISTMFLCAPSVYATPPLEDYEGRNLGNFIVGAHSDVVLEKAEIKIKAPDLPDDRISAETYSSNAVSDYTFYNPTSSDRTAVVCFGYDDAPDYTYYFEDYRHVYFDGAQADFQKRYTPVVKNENDAVSFAVALSDEYLPEWDITPDTKLYVQTYKITSSDAVQGKEIFACFSAERYNKMVFGVSASVNNRRMNIKVENNRFTLITSEKQFDDIYDFYFSRSAENTEPVQVEYELQSMREISYSDYINSHMPFEDEDVSEDIYACYTAKIENSEYRIFSEEEFFKDKYRTWNKTEFVIPAGGRTVMTVKEPFFPGIDEMPSPDVYAVGIDIPYATKAENFEMKIEVETSYYVIGNKDFVKTQNGYEHTVMGAQPESVYFALCTSENPSKDGSGGWIVLLILLLPLLLLGVVIAIVLFLICAAVVFVCIGAAVAAVVLIVYGIVRLIMFIVKKARK